MALYRQGSGSVQAERAAFRAANGSVGIYRHKVNARGRRLSRLPRLCQCSVGAFALVLLAVVFVTLLASNYHFSDTGVQHTSGSGDLHEQGLSSHFSFWNSKGQDRSLTETSENKVGSGGNEIPEQKGVSKHKQDIIDNGSNQNPKVLHFGQGSSGSGRDSRYWDRDDRRRDEEYDEEDSVFWDEEEDIGNHGQAGVRKAKENTEARKDQEGHAKSIRKPNGQDFGNGGLYNEEGRDELILYEEQYEAALKRELGLDNGDASNKEHDNAQIVNGRNDEKDLSNDNKHTRSRNSHTNSELTQEQLDLDDEYDDGFDDDDFHTEESEVLSIGQDMLEITEKLNNNPKHHDWKDLNNNNNNTHEKNTGFKDHQNGRNGVLDGHFEKESTLLLRGFHQDKSKGTLVSNPQLEDSSRKDSVDKKRTSLKKRTKKHKHASTSCEPRFLNSTSQLVEPEENSKFAKFALQYVESEEKPDGVDHWEPRFAGHQSLDEREASFYARDQTLHCGFVKGPKSSRSTGFDLSEEDAQFLNTCHIAVSSCIFGNSDKLRTPPGKKVTLSSKKNVCFVMFIDEKTLNTMSAEGRQPDEKGYIGLWKIVVVRNLPYTDMRRSGKVPKFLTHRLFPSARYSIWLDSKLRLQSDPLLILEYFLWRRDFEYAISNHYDRHCVWEEVMQNKRLNKFNHTIIDQQFAFYQSDGLTRFNATDPNKLLPSHVPEGSFIVRAHTPMSNLFSCLWFNEVDRFTPRDQLSFAYTYFKLGRMNLVKHFRLNMFKDCERRGMAKLFHHRIDEKPTVENSSSL